MIEYDEINVIPYVSDLDALVSKLSLKLDGTMAANAALDVKGGRVTLSDSRSNVRKFMNGRIVYEDGHAWKRDNYGKSLWGLVDGKGRRILSCEVSDEGIQSISFTKEYKDDKKAYREFISDFMDMIDEII